MLRRWSHRSKASGKSRSLLSRLTAFPSLVRWCCRSRTLVDSVSGLTGKWPLKHRYYHLQYGVQLIIGQSRDRASTSRANYRLNSGLSYVEWRQDVRVHPSISFPPFPYPILPLSDPFLLLIEANSTVDLEECCKFSKDPNKQTPADKHISIHFEFKKKHTAKHKFLCRIF